MQKENHLLRMRRSGWFDIMMLFLAFALVLGVLGLVGVISYHNAMGRVTADMTEYEITHSLSALARARSTYLTAAAVCLWGFCVCALFRPWSRPIRAARWPCAAPCGRCSISRRRSLPW